MNYVEAPQNFVLWLQMSITLVFNCLDIQLLYPLFLWHSFDDFLKDMKQNKRKNIRQERKKVRLTSCV